MIEYDRRDVEFGSMSKLEGEACEAQQGTDEPNTLDGMKSTVIEIEDVSPDDAKINGFEVEDVNTKANFASSRRITLYTYYYTTGKLLGIIIIALSYSPANSAFLEVPNNAVVLQWSSAGSVEMACKSDCECDLRWFMKKHNDPENEDLYNGYAINPDAKSYCEVMAAEPGEVYLNLTNKPDAAQTYICFEPETLEEKSAELIWIGAQNHIDNSTAGVVNLTCSIDFQGNWQPTIEWREQSNYEENVLSVGVIATVVNQCVTSTLSLPLGLHRGRRNYTCSTKFDITGKPHHTTARNIPGKNLIWTFIKSEDEIMTAKPIAAILLTVILAGAVGLLIAVCAIVYVVRRQWKKNAKTEGERRPAELVSLHGCLPADPSIETSAVSTSDNSI